jgi:hypothetical protein
MHQQPWANLPLLSLEVHDGVVELQGHHRSRRRVGRFPLSSRACQASCASSTTPPRRRRAACRPDGLHPGLAAYAAWSMEHPDSCAFSGGSKTHRGRRGDLFETKLSLISHHATARAIMPAP